MEYTIVVTTESTSALADLVNEKIMEGWVPQGGIAIASHTFTAINNDSTMVFAQALIKN